jgi:hypothetical protein
MNAALPFDEVRIEGASIGADALVPGSLSLSISGEDKLQPALDGSLAASRLSRTRAAAFRALGDLRSLTTPRGAPVAVSILLATKELFGGLALATTKYDSEARASSVRLDFEPET